MPSTVTTFAPGRVEILGNHTDYNLGLVLSAAIHLGVKIEAARLSSSILEISSQTNGRSVSIELSSLRHLSEDAWANYPIGVIKILAEAGFQLGGMRLNISSDLPLGAGLSSSAALEVATAMAAQALFDLELEKMPLARLCQKAENEFVGVQSGLLDQASSVFGKSHQLILLDFLQTSVETVSLPKETSLLLLNSGVPHELTGGEYNERRKQCTLAAKTLGVASLRDANLELLGTNRDLDHVTRRRALHIIGENERVVRGVQALRSNQLEDFGELMFASHFSSRVNFENSTSHLDTLVDLAKQTEGVFGSRLTGGGFGGSTVSLVETARAEIIIQTISSEYHRITGATCSPILTEPSEGARILA
jgi:galactokinase